MLYLKNLFAYYFQIIEQRWNKLAAHLKKYLCEQLLQLPSAPCSSCCSNFSLDRRLELVESYRSLCNDDDTWLKYKALRTQQLEDVFAKLLPEVSVWILSYLNCFIILFYSDQSFKDQANGNLLQTYKFIEPRYFSNTKISKGTSNLSNQQLFLNVIILHLKVEQKLKLSIVHFVWLTQIPLNFVFK